MSIVFSPFPMEPEYRAFFQQLEGTHFESTGVVPVMAKGTGYETWPNFIISLNLRDFLSGLNNPDRIG